VTAESTIDFFKIDFFGMSLIFARLTHLESLLKIAGRNSALFKLLLSANLPLPLGLR
jgi:hypothetical protein